MSGESLRGLSHIREAGGIYLHGTGTYDLSTRMQGMQPDVQEPYPITERLAVDMESGRVAYESDTNVNPDAREWIRYIYDGQNRMLFLELYSGFAFWSSEAGLNAQGKRYSNMVPQLLLDEALGNRSSLKYLGADGEGNRLVSFDAPSYGTVTLYINEESRYLTGVEYLKDMPLLGDTPIRWRFKSYKPADGIGLYPTGYTVHLKGKLLKDISYTTVQAGLEGVPLFNIPDSISVPQMPEPPATGEVSAPPVEAPARDPMQLAGGVYVFPHIRSGFHPLVVEFEEYLMVVDTPAGWFEMQQLPAIQWVEGVTSSSTGRKLLKAIKERFPAKPVRYIALTHFHSDHAGGIRPFIEAGATVLASSVTAPVIEQAVENGFSLEPDELSGKQVAPKIEIVEEEYRLSDGTMEVRLIDVGNNPHADGMLVAYLPKQKILYQSDLFEPSNMNFFPNKSRLPVMKWFVNWLDNSGLEAEHIYAIHAGLRVTEEHLSAIRALGD